MRLFSILLCSLAIVETALGKERPRPYAKETDGQVEERALSMDAAAILELGQRGRSNARERLKSVADEPLHGPPSTDSKSEPNTAKQRTAKYSRIKARAAKDAARMALARMGERKYLRELVDELKSSDERKRVEAARALGYVGDRRTVKYVAALLSESGGPKGTPHEPAPSYAQLACYALEEILPDAHEAIRRRNPGKRFFLVDEWRAWWKENAKQFEEGIE